MRGWLAPVQTEHALRVRFLLGAAGTVTVVVATQLLILGLGTFAFLPLGAPLTVLGFLGVCFGLALLGQGIMPWETSPSTSGDASAR